MTRLMQTVLLVLVGLAVLAAASPALIKLAAAFVPLVLVSAWLSLFCGLCGFTLARSGVKAQPDWHLLARIKVLTVS